MGIRQQRNILIYLALLPAFLFAQQAGTINDRTSLRPETGAVVRPAQAKLNETISVKDFGAIGDGIADDHAAIQAGISALGTLGGGTLIFPCGTYSLSGSLVHIGYSNVVLDGLGCATIHQTVNNVGGILAASDGTNFVQVHDVRVTGLTFTGVADGSGTNVSVGFNVETPTGAVYSRGVNGAYNIHVEKSNFSGWSMGVMGTGVTDFWIHDNYFTGNHYIAALAAGGYGILTQTCYGIHIYSNVFKALPAGDRHSIYISCDGGKGSNYWNEDVHIDNNTIDWQTPTSATLFETAMAVRAVHGLSISGNTVNGGYTGIVVALNDGGYGDAEDVSIVGNTVTGTLGASPSERAAIEILGGAPSNGTAYRVTIVGNTINSTNNSVHGIVVNSVVDGVIAGNQVSVAGSGSFGLEIFGCTRIQDGPNALNGTGTAYAGEAILTGGPSSNSAITRVPGSSSGFGFGPVYNTSGYSVANLLDPGAIQFLSQSLSPVTDPRFTWDATAGALDIGAPLTEAGNPRLNVWGWNTADASAKAGVMQQSLLGTFDLGSYNQLRLYANVGTGNAPSTGVLGVLVTFNAVGGTPAVVIGGASTDGSHNLQVTGSGVISAATNESKAIVSTDAVQTLTYKDLSSVTNTFPSGVTLPLAALGDTLYENATPAPAALAGNITATRKFLRQLGTGTVSAAPAWDTLQAVDLPYPLSWDATNKYLHFGTPSTEATNPIVKLWGWDTADSYAHPGQMQQSLLGTYDFGSYNGLRIYSGVSGGSAPSTGTLTLQAGVYSIGSNPYVVIGGASPDGSHNLQVTGSGVISAATNESKAIVSTDATQTLTNKNLSDPSNTLPACSGGFTTQSVASPWFATPTTARAVNTPYHNTGPCAILVSISLTSSIADEFTAYSDSGSSPSTQVGLAGGVTALPASMAFLVLPGNYYKIVVGGGSTTTNSWVEYK